MLLGSALLQRNLIFNRQKRSGPGAPSAKRLVRTSHTAVMQSFPPDFKKHMKVTRAAAESGSRSSFKMVEGSVCRQNGSRSLSTEQAGILQ
ncbi:uncharacterized, partial [Tachysurus ichikawai]